MFDASCGEIFGPSVISKEQPEHVYRDFNTILEARSCIGATLHCRKLSRNLKKLA